MASWFQRIDPTRPVRAAGRILASNLGSLRYYLGDNRNPRDDVGEAGETVLVIQGFFQTRRVMETLENRLRADGYRVISFHLGGLLGNFNTRGVPSLARLVDLKVRRLQERYGLDKIHVIGHSMGGIIGRYLVQRAGGSDYVRTLVTLGSPHHGTPTAAIGAGMGLLLVSRALWQLFPMSPLIRDLNDSPVPEGVRLVSVYSQHDLVCPWRSSVLTLRDGGSVRNVLVKGLGHMGLVEDPYVYGLVLRELKERPTEVASGPVAAADEEFSLLGSRPQSAWRSVGAAAEAHVNLGEVR